MRLILRIVLKYQAERTRYKNTIDFRCLLVDSLSMNRFSHVCNNVPCNCFAWERLAFIARNLARIARCKRSATLSHRDWERKMVGAVGRQHFNSADVYLTIQKGCYD